MRRVLPIRDLDVVLVPDRGLAPRRRQLGMMRLNTLTGFWGKKAAAGGGPPPFSVDAVEFTSGDFMTRASDFSGLADSKLGICSFWFKRAATGQNYQEVLSAVVTAGVDYLAWFLDGADGSGAHHVAMWIQHDASNFTAIYSANKYDDTLWHHAFFVWDLTDAAKCKVYVDGVDTTASAASGNFVITNLNINYTQGSWTFGADDGNTTLSRLAACVADFYWAPGQWIDPTLVNREKFRSSLAVPVDLGATGSTPTGTAPKAYFHLNDGDAAAGWATNDSANGDMTITGTLTTCATSPADGVAAGPTVDAAFFDGADGLSKTTTFTGLTGSNDALILSFWAKPDNLAATRTLLEGYDLGGDAVRLKVEINTSGQIVVSTGGSGQSSFALSTSSWNHVLLTNSGICINGRFDQDSSISISSIDYTNTNRWYVAQNESLGARFVGGLAELYFAPHQTLDPSQAGNQVKFRNVLGKPVDLGATGATPTGTVPELFCHLADAEAAANFATNRSGNGNMTVDGTLSTYASSPSD